MALLGHQFRLEGAVLGDDVMGTPEPGPLPDHRRSRGDADRGGPESEVAAVGFAPDSDGYFRGPGLVDDAVEVVGIREIRLGSVARTAAIPVT